MPTVTAVTTIAALKALDPATNPDVEVENYHSDVQGGGGLFYWKAGDTTDDNGGTVIASTFPGANGRWRRSYTDPLNVRWFGAKGNGSFDDAPAIQAALKELYHSQGSASPTISVGGVVFLPRGKYRITTPILLKGNQRLLGEGDGSVIHEDFPSTVNLGSFGSVARADCGAIEIRDTTTLNWAEGVRVENLVINTANSMGVRCRDADPMLLINACFKDLVVSTKGDSFSFPGTQAYVQDCVFENIRFRSVGAGLIRIFGNANVIRMCNSEQGVRPGYDGNLYAIVVEASPAAASGYDNLIEDCLLEHSTPRVPIVAVDTVGKKFTVAGDHVAYFYAGLSARVMNSTGNDGVYTVVSSALSGGNTVITVSESIPNATADGTIAPGGTRAMHIKGGGHHIRSNWVEFNAPGGDGVAYKFEACDELFLDRLFELSPTTKASFTDCRSVHIDLIDTRATMDPLSKMMVVSNSHVTIGEHVSYFGPDDWEDPQIRILRWRNTRLDFTADNIWAPHTGNLLPNGDFEEGTAGWAVANANGGTHDPLVVVDDPEDGGKALKLTVTSNPFRIQLAGPLLNLPADLAGGPGFVGFWLKSDASIVHVLLDTDGTAQANRNTNGLVVGKLPSVAASYFPTIYVYGTGTVYIRRAHVVLGRTYNHVPTRVVKRTWTSGNSERQGTAAPTSGTYKRGDIVWNSQPSAGGTVGWVCTAAGSPGTWKTFGGITA